MRRIVLTFGLIAGAVLSLTLLLTALVVDRLSTHSLLFGYAAMVLGFLIVFFGVRAYRDTVCDGAVGFWRALGVGLLISLVASLCYVVTWEILYFTVFPDFADKYAAHVMEHARASGATAAQLAARSQEMETFRIRYRNPLYNSAMTFLEPLPVALVMSLVAAATLRRRRPAGRAERMSEGATAAG